MVPGRCFCISTWWIAFLPSPCEQLSRTQREQSFTVTEVNVYVPSKSTFKMPTSWILSNLTRDVVRKITCQEDLLVVASQRWRMCDLYTETWRLLIGLKQGKVNGSDRPIYFTPLTSEACGEPHSLFNMSPGHASPAAPAFLLGIQGVVRRDSGQNSLLVIFWQQRLLLAWQRAHQPSVTFSSRIWAMKSESMKEALRNIVSYSMCALTYSDQFSFVLFESAHW